MYILFILGGGLFLLLYTICMHVLVVGYLSPYSGGGQQASHTSANEIEVLVVGSQLLEGASLAEVHPLGDLHLACPLQLLRILDDEVVRGDILEGVDLVFGHVHRQTAGQRADYIFDSQ